MEDAEYLKMLTSAELEGQTRKVRRGKSFSLKFTEHGSKDDLLMPNRGYSKVAVFDDGTYWARGTGEQMELVRIMVLDLLGAGRAQGIADGQVIQLTAAEAEALTA